MRRWVPLMALMPLVMGAIVADDDDDNTGPAEHRGPIVIRSTSGSHWMGMIGGVQRDVEIFHLTRPTFRMKSLQMDFGTLPPTSTVISDDSQSVYVMPFVGNLEVEKLGEKIRERAQLGQFLVEGCFGVSPDGESMSASTWADGANIQSEAVVVTDQTEQSELRRRIRLGFVPISVCGFRRNFRSQYLFVFIRKRDGAVGLDQPQSRLVFGLTAEQCNRADTALKRAGFVAHRIHFHHSVNNEIRCAAIYWSTPGYRHQLEFGTNLRQMADRMAKRDKAMSPKGIFRFSPNEFAVLWSSAPMWALPFSPAPKGFNGRIIPQEYGTGITDELSTDFLSFIHNRITQFMQRFDIPGLSVAIAKNEHLKYTAAFGFANIKTERSLTPDHKFRLGSIAKVVTSAAIGILIDEQRLSFDDHVFGQNGIFGMEYADGPNGYHPFVELITVRHLMSHTVGGWSNNGEEDPVFAGGNATPVQLIHRVVNERPPRSPPGVHYEYSNFGYLLLGEIIARRSGMSYVDFVNHRLFEAVGLPHQQLLEVGYPFGKDEVVYYPTPEMYDDPYELPNAQLLAACCGWQMTPKDALQFVTHVDGFPLKTDLISPEMFVELGIPTKESNFTYGMGWSVNERGFNGRSHQGQMPASLALLVRTDSGVEIIIASNRFPPRHIAFPEIAYLSHHLISLFEGAEPDAVDHFQS